MEQRIPRAERQCILGEFPSAREKRSDIRHQVIEMMRQVSRMSGAFEVVRHREMAPDFRTFKLWVRVA